jgi:hypothetical protein
LRLQIANENPPTLGILLPGAPANDKSIAVIFPEHVTARLRNSAEVDHLYLAGTKGARHYRGKAVDL